MHFVGPDQFHGFEKRLFGDNGPFLSKEICGHGFNRTNGQTKYAVEVSGHGNCGYQEYDRLVTEHACRFVDDHDPADRPYCLVVGYTLPHNPLICRRDLFEYYLERIPVPEPVSAEYLAKLNPGLRKWRERRGVDDLTPEQNHRALAAYYGLVTEMDGNVGAIIEAARTSAAGDNTVVIYCSDHGDHACEHGMWWKSSHLEGSARVPLLVSCPGQPDGGRTVEAVVSLIDVGPTVLELAGADPLPDVAGRSLAGFLRRDSAPTDWPNEIFCEYIGAHGDQPSCMVRSGDWKLIYYAEFDSHLLYNLKTDPEELDDRAGDPVCAEIATTLLEKIHGRWSAAKMLEGGAKERRAQALIRGCGHPLMPHPVPRPDPLERAHQFDFSQVPNWPEIRTRFDDPPDAPS
ncbi:sulfatase-like hydrolase/transferase [Candidatus Poribacteria bacterium]|nr:sulfatase-like hydrolase/transferase [Candidatus Poribacteria bacterium]